MNKEFVAFGTDPDHITFINLALVRRAVYHKDGKIITLIFSETHQVEITDDALAQTIFGKLMERGTNLNGEPHTNLESIKLVKTL